MRIAGKNTKNLVNTKKKVSVSHFVLPPKMSQGQKEIRSIFTQMASDAFIYASSKKC